MPEKHIRQSNFELLRIIAMSFIVLGHSAGQSGILKELNGVSLLCVTFLSSASRISVNLFLMIGCWFMVERPFKAERVLKLYGELWFYTVSVTLLLKVVGLSVSSITLASCFFPYLRRCLWFASAYISLLLLSPFLNKLLACKEVVLRRLLCVLFLIVSVFTTFMGTNDMWLCAIAWFCSMYLLVGYYKKYLHGRMKNYLLYIILAGGGVRYFVLD